MCSADSLQRWPRWTQQDAGAGVGVLVQALLSGSLLGSTGARAGSEQLRAKGSPTRSPALSPVTGVRPTRWSEFSPPLTDRLLLLLAPPFHRPGHQQVSGSSSSSTACSSEAQTHAGSSCAGQSCTYPSPPLPQQGAPLS